MTVKQNATKENRKNKGEVKWTKKWCIGDYCLFKVGFNQLINELSFMHHWDFVLAISRIENTHMNMHSSNQLMTLSVGIYVAYIWTSPLSHTSQYAFSWTTPLPSECTNFMNYPSLLLMLWAIIFLMKLNFDDQDLRRINNKIKKHIHEKKEFYKELK